ncbi:helix-turn-helix transcriptional regulator [Streptomyces sp. 4N509B]|uniref:helix-turn-helix transcriptional regulator n=1 Tax=Streptomyces sp. 4N509B TaxID=3457413 RepID=UPI003FD5BBBB
MTAVTTHQREQRERPAPQPRRGQRRRPELAAFLRGRRARIRPEEVGLPPGPRRRTPGLRREEVAQLAGVGITWYTWLEQGRPINVSPQVLDAVARTLRLDGPEREHLYDLAGVPHARRPESATTAVGAEVQAVLDALDPVPATLYNGRYDVLAFNAAYWSLFFSTACPGTLRANALWALFTGEPSRCPLVHREEELRLMVATLRGAYGAHVGEPAWEGFVRELCAASGEFAAMWSSGDVLPPGPRVKSFRHPAVGELRLRTVSLSVDGVPEARMVVYTPIDDVTRGRMGALRAALPALPASRTPAPAPA